MNNMATEFKLNYSGSEINRKLADVDAIRTDLENSYYTSADIDIKFTENDGKFDEVNENIDTKIGEVNSSIDTKIDEVNTSLTFKADLIEGKVPVEQIPDDIVDLSGYYTKEESDANLTLKADLVDGKVPLSQLPDDIGSGNGGTQVQADHAQNDDTQPDYIKNRIAYSNGVKNVDVLNQTLTFGYDGDMGIYMSVIEGLSNTDIASWKSLGDIVVMWDTTAYPVSKTYFEGEGANFWGNAMIAGLDDTGEPFVIAIDDYNKTIMLMSLTDPAPDDPDNAPTIDHTIEISYQKDDVYTDPKYFNMDNILTVKSGDVIHKKTKYIFEFDEDMGMGCCYLDGIPFVLPEGKKIKVYWDNVEYLCTVTQIGEGSDDMLAVGSIDAMMNEDLSLANEPFLIIISNTDQYTDIYSLNTNLVHELKIVAEDEYQTTIDSKYLSMPFKYDDYAMFGSENLLTSGTIYKILGNRGYLTIDNEVYSYSTNPVSSQAVYNALQNVDVEVDDTVNSYSNNAVSSKAVYNALQNIDLSSKQDKINVSYSDNGKFMRVVDGAWAAVAVPNAEEGEF